MHVVCITHLRDIPEYFTQAGRHPENQIALGLGIIVMWALNISALHFHCLSPLITQLPKLPLY